MIALFRIVSREAIRGSWSDYHDPMGIHAPPPLITAGNGLA